MSVGQSQARIDAPAKLTGEADYPGDRIPDDALWAMAVFTDQPHARLVGLDFTAAEAVPGVVAVFGSADVPVNEFGLTMNDHPVFVGIDHTGRSQVACDVSRWEADRLALVVADSPATARTAAAAISARWEPLGVLADIDESLGSDTLLHPENGKPTNAYHSLRIRKGDMARGWAEADVVVEATYEFPYQEHAYLQPEAGLAYIDDQGRVTVEVAGQWTHEDREQIAHSLDLPAEQVRVIYPAIGGAFGGREDISVQIVLALAAVRLAERGISRPVAAVWSREESIVGHGKRHRGRITARWGARRDGRITAVKSTAWLDAGAYNFTSNKVLGNCHLHQAGPYEVPNAEIDSFAVYTNATPAGAFRGFGAPQAAFAAESQMNKLAEALAMDPVQIRCVNALREGSIGITQTPLPEGVTMPEVINRCAEAAAWPSAADFTVESRIPDPPNQTSEHHAEAAARPESAADSADESAITDPPNQTSKHHAEAATRPESAADSADESAITDPPNQTSKHHAEAATQPESAADSADESAITDPPDRTSKHCAEAATRPESAADSADESAITDPPSQTGEHRAEAASEFANESSAATPIAPQPAAELVGRGFSPVLSLPAEPSALRRGRGFACSFKNVGFSFGFPERCEARIVLHGSEDGDANSENGDGNGSGKGGADSDVNTGEGSYTNSGENGEGFDKPGWAELFHAAAEVGQGNHTVLVQMAAEATGLPPERIKYRLSDTATSGDAGSASASRLTWMSGNSILGAAEEAEKAWRDGQRPAVGRFRFVPPPTEALDPVDGRGAPNFSYGYVAQCVELTVDTETGHIRVDRVVSAHDVGQAINPQLVIGQIEGAVIQGHGYALSETLRSCGGRLQNTRLSTYLIPGIGDIPTRVDSVVLELADPLGPWGARGMAEMGLIPYAPAVVAALHDATGIWFNTFPLTPDHVIATLHTANPRGL